MKESVNQFIQRMKEDPSFAQEVTNKTSKENLLAFAQSQGISLAMEDIDLVNEAIKQEWLENISTETPAGALIHKMMSDSAFAEKVISQQDPEEIIKIAAEEGVTLTSDDLQEANRQLQQRSGQSGAPTSGELSEEDLEQVAGGTLLSSVTEISIISSLVVTTMVTITAASLVSVTMKTLLGDAR